MHVLRTVVLAAALAGSVPFAEAQPATPPPRAALTPQQTAAIDGFVKDEMARQRIPGLEVGIYSRGRILLAKGYGLANVELNVPVKPETVFQSGSIGKQFAAAAIMMLVEEGKLSLDDSITKYFPQAPDSWKPIRIKNLLSHTSGLSDYSTVERTGPNGPFYERLDFTEDELMAKIEAMPVEWPAGSKWDYCNTNYVMLGILIHKLTGEPYAQFLSEHIFTPLGMKSAQLISDRDIIYNRASGYALDNGQLKNEEWVSPTFNATADGSLYFNVLDFAKWDAALYTTRLLSQVSLDRIWTVYPLNDGLPNPAHYGFGWFIERFHGHKVMRHNGKTWGFTSTILRYPDDSLSVVVLTNQYDADAESIADVVAGLIDPVLLPTKLASIRDTDPSIAISARALLDQLARGNDFRVHTMPDFALLITPEVTARWLRRLTPFWPGGTLTLVAREPSSTTPNQVNSIFRLSKGGKAVLIFYNRTATGKIHGFDISDDRPYE
ncbi:MAG TPA: serine hydrolase domain-containing protein [Rhizomicrobium sp.]|nr:serine hydrolase domain-containing protein [Rhizomicrobium sp.]